MAAGDPTPKEDQLKETLLRAVDQQARRKARIVGAVTAVVAAWIMSMFFFYDSCGAGPKPGVVTGNLETDVPALADLGLSPDTLRCYSGQPKKFRGVELLPSRGPGRIEIHEDELRGSFVQFARGEQKLFLDADRCARFEIQLETYEGRTSGGLGFGGSLDLDCQLPDGKVAAHLTFDHCPD